MTSALPILAALFSSSAAFHLRHAPRVPNLAGRLVTRRLFSGIAITGATATSHDAPDGSPLEKPTNRHKPSPLAGMPLGPSLPSNDDDPVIVRYMYEGGHIGQGRLCHLHPSQDISSHTIAASQVIRTLRDDGVDFDAFYACAYESERSADGWMPLEPPPRDRNPWTDENDDGRGCDVTFAMQPPGADVSRRIDIKLFRRPRAAPRTDAIQSLDNAMNVNAPSDTAQSAMTPVEHSSDALRAISASVPGGKLPLDKGYFGIGILHPKTSQNVGTLWRSAYQLGASVLYTIGGRYKSSSADTLNVPARIPLLEVDDWNAFVEGSAPKAAVWVAIEMGGTPLVEFQHPRNAVYILGSEDHGLPTSVLRGCREVVSLESELYGSYNVAVAGSIVMYDRLMKMRAAEKERKEGGGK